VKKPLGGSDGIWIWITNTGGTKALCVSTLMGAAELGSANLKRELQWSARSFVLWHGGR
jgi:hypothetical protein